MSAVPTLPPIFYRALRLLPLMSLQLPSMLTLRAVVVRHPQIFVRLGVHADKRFGIEPVDLPVAFVLEPRRNSPSITVVRKLPHDIPSRIAGPLAGLVGLIDGCYDGDALFFSRELVVEGDIEAVVALRNAIDSESIDLIAEVAAMLGPLAPFGRLLLGHMQSRLRSVSARPFVGAEPWS